MNKVLLLQKLGAFTARTVKDLILPVQPQKVCPNPAPRAAEVYLMRLTDSKAAKQKAPYIIHQVITGSDGQNPGELTESRCTIRSIFCTYNPDEQEGSLELLNLMERVRIALLENMLFEHQFQLDIKSTPLETMVYPEDTAPFYAGEMVSTWIIPRVQRKEVDFRL